MPKMGGNVTLECNGPILAEFQLPEQGRAESAYIVTREERLREELCPPRVFDLRQGSLRQLGWILTHYKAYFNKNGIKYWSKGDV